MDMLERVTMMAGIRVLEMTSPLNSPNKMAIPRPMRTDNQTGVPPFINPAANVPVTATMEPTERSIPPVRITKVIPEAMMAYSEICLTRLIRLLRVRK